MIWIKRSLFGSVKKTVWLGFLVILGLVIFQHKEVQAVFGIGIIKQDVEMSPEIKGRLTENGKPIVGATIARTIVYEGYKKGQEQLQHTVTDDEGRFSFPKMTVKSRYPKDIFGQNALVGMGVYYENKDTLYQIWHSSSSWQALRAPIPDLLLQLDCDLNNKKITYVIDTTDLNSEQYKVEQLASSICYFINDKATAYLNDEVINSFDDI
ncbi:hypothetical protein F9L16_09885 [Agarivorans sp. B2Z047]|uniref:DUF6795 domain-containing protein n=1 Tax=Agarivorans sp. B2Z047 TaxID=2652721 RepID=UPI00128B2ABE|nr:DUF6795 domain-containing protein [Agarivorans sp. B2Z047]MPW29308.1 hypothetical protein [Agarivorans sp. B2Z047]UQN44895.1 DUF4198 domain-containing protein [Agarivorans sp. B2Z047]